MTDENITLETDIVNEDAAREIAKAVSTRHSIARRYVLRLRRRNLNATPAELIRIIERRYASTITTAGVAVAAAGIAANVGISMIPLAGTAAIGAKEVTKHAAKEAAKVTVKEATKAAAKGAALDAAKGGAQRVAGFLPAGDQQLQFEITAIFALAIADIHGLEYDKEQAHALVFGLTNERVSPQQIAGMAADVAKVSSGSVVEAASGKTDSTKWATTLAESLPWRISPKSRADDATGHLESVRGSMNEKQQHAVDYGVAAVAGGVTRFVFGREVVNAARAAFPEAPEEFPTHLVVPLRDDEGDDEPNRALSALEGAGTRIAGAAGSATRVFRSVDLDGDGIPDEARALTAVKGAGGTVAGAAGAVGSRVTGLLKRGSARTSPPMCSSAVLARSQL